MNSKFVETPPLLVRLNADLGRLKAGTVAELPQWAAISVIHRRLGIPVAEFNAYADVSLGLDDLVDAGLGAFVTSN